MAVNQTQVIMETKVKWILLKNEVPECRCFVTNNIGARDSKGYMANIWITHAIRKEGKKFTASDDNLNVIKGVTHYAFLPKI